MRRRTPNNILADAVIDNVNPNSVERINRALDNGADIHFSTNVWDSTPLHEAVKVPNNIRNINALLDRGANVNEESGDENTPLMDAVKVPNNNTNIKHLLSRGADINLIPHGRPIHEIVHPTNRDVIIREVNFQERKPYLQLTEGIPDYENNNINRYLFNDLIQKEVSSYNGKKGGKTMKKMKKMKKKKMRKTRKY